MNERIKELAEQAGWDNHHSKFDTRIKKFAELIVKECLSQVDKIRDGLEADSEDQQALGADWAGLAIARHFGVEDQVENSNQEHTCPYKEEIHGDYKTLCNCDPEQTRQCSQDI